MSEISLITFATLLNIQIKWFFCCYFTFLYLPSFQIIFVFFCSYQIEEVARGVLNYYRWIYIAICTTRGIYHYILINWMTNDVVVDENWEIISTHLALGKVSEGKESFGWSRLPKLLVWLYVYTFKHIINSSRYISTNYLSCLWLFVDIVYLLDIWGL